MPEKAINFIIGLIVIASAVWLVHITRIEGIQNEYYQANREAEQGIVSSQVRLALMYHKGWGNTEPNNDLAVKWYKEAAANGSRTAKSILKDDFGISDVQ